MDLPEGSDQRGRVEIRALIFGAFAVFLFAKLVFWFPKDTFGSGMDDWVYTDWLVDYSAGFVRRGLAGEGVRLLTHFAPAKVVVSFLIWSIFGLLAFGYVRLIGRSLARLSPLLLTGLLFLPSLLPFYLHDHGAFGRKEMLGFLVVLWHLHLLERCRSGDASGYLKKFLPLSLIALPVHALIHEPSLLQFVPVHALISYAMVRRDAAISFQRRILTVALLYFPVFAACVIAAVFGRPTLQMALAIIRHWEVMGALPPGSSDLTGKEGTLWPLPGAFSSLAWSFSQATSLSLSLTRRIIGYWVFIMAVLGFFTAWIGGMVTVALTSNRTTPSLDLKVFRARLPLTMLGKYFLLPFLLSLPLYILGWDMGRWFAATCLNYMLVALSPEVTDAERAAIDDPNPLSEPPAHTNVTSAFSFVFYVKLTVFLLALAFLRLPRFENLGFNMFAQPLTPIFAKLFSFHFT